MAIRVLIAEDDPIQALYVSTVLGAARFAVCGVAATALDAVRLAEAERPHVITMDLQLTGPQDGLAAVTALRWLYGFGLVFLTAYAMSPVLLNRMQALKPDAILSKPTDEQTLLDAVYRALGVGEPPA
jgi:DNA-binding NarL/FixJ family response regulator